MKTDDELDAGDGGAPAQTEELRAMEAIVRAAKLQTTREFDERVLADAATTPRALPRGVRIAAGIVVAIALGGALTAAVAGWIHRGGDAVSDLSQREPAIHRDLPKRAAPKPSTAQARRVPERADRPANAGSGETDSDEVIEEPEPASSDSGWPIDVDARATVREAPIIARIHLNGVVRAARSGFIDPRRGVIEAVYKGDAALVGRGVTIHAKRLATRRSFICWSEEGKTSIGEGVGTVVMPLEPTNVGIPEAGDIHLRVALADRFGGTLVGSMLPVRATSSSEDEIIAMLREDLVASLSASNVSVRRSSIQALRNWNWTGVVPDADSNELWRDESTAKALLAAGRDEDPMVRSIVAWMVNPAGGAEGRELLEDLLFDPDAVVRQEVARVLRHEGGPPFLDTIENMRDQEWDRFLSSVMPLPLATSLSGGDSHATLRDLKLQELKESDEPENRAEIAWALGGVGPSKETSDALLAALDDPDFEVRRGAAHSLGMVGGEDVPDRLDSIANTEDPRVRVMAAWSQVNLGDRRGYAHLSRLVTGDDTRAAAQACAALGRIAKKESVALLLTAGEDQRPAVHGAAVVALARRALKEDAPHREAVAALLASAEKDEDAYVRAAARAALRQRTAKQAAAALRSDDAKLIALLGYVDDSLSDSDSDDE